MKYWIQAARPRTLPLALASILMGSFLAKANTHFNWPICILTILTTIILQVLSNFANDFGDTQNGADLAGRVGPERAVQSGKISSIKMKIAIVISTIIALVSGVSLLYVSFNNFNSYQFYGFLALGILSIIAAITYTATKKPYGYAGLGDLSVLIFFGFVGVMGTYYLQTKSLNWLMILPTLSTGLFATAVLNINNLRDISSDKLAGKNTIPVRFGKLFGVFYHRFLIVGGILTTLIYVIIYYKSWYQLFFLLSVPFFVKIAIGIQEKDEPTYIDTFLKKMALTSLLFSILFGIGQILA